MKIHKLSLTHWGSWILIALLIAMPFHAALVVISTNVSPALWYVAAWKELAVLFLSLFALIAYYKDRSLFRFSTLNVLCLAIIVLSLIVTLLNQNSVSAVLVGIKTNIVVLVLFLCAQIFAQTFHFEQLKKYILLPAGIVSLFAIVQLVIPIWLMQYLGYNANTISPTQYIEPTQSLIRVFSTLGGPNQLGTYLILPIATSVVLFMRTRKFLWLAPFALFSSALIFTYSRSAWLGAIIALFVAALLFLKKKYQVISIVVLAIAFVLLFFAVMLLTRCEGNSQINNFIIHATCENGSLLGSDTQRLESINTGLQRVEKNVFGLGLGSAGPSSFYSNNPIITENWYLQITLEVGIAGLLLYAAFFGLLSSLLYKFSSHRSKNADFAKIVLATLLGVLVSSLFLHSMADSTISIILFILLGIATAKAGVAKP